MNIKKKKNEKKNAHHRRGVSKSLYVLNKVFLNKAILMLINCLIIITLKIDSQVLRFFLRCHTTI